MRHPNAVNFYYPFAESERFHSREVRFSPYDSKISHFAIGKIFHCNTENCKVFGIACATLK